MTNATAAFNRIVEQVAVESNGNKRRKIINSARPLIKKTMAVNNKLGRPGKYTKAIGDKICMEVANGKTLVKVADEMGVTPHCIYEWLNNNADFSDNYDKSRQSWAKTLVDRTLEESEHIDPSESFAKKVRIDFVKWCAARYAPAQFSESKRIELKGEVNHLHTHQLAEEQKRRIAEAWLISSGQGETVVIPDETGKRPALEHQPDDLEAAGVKTVADKQERIIPGRTRTELTRKVKGKPGRKPKSKPNIDD